MEKRKERKTMQKNLPVPPPPRWGPHDHPYKTLKNFSIFGPLSQREIAYPNP